MLVGIVSGPTEWTVFGSISYRGERLLTCSKRQDLLWGPPKVHLNVYRRFFPGGKAAGA